MNKNKKILKNAIGNDMYPNNHKKISTILQSHKRKRDHKSNYSVSKDKLLKTYKESSLSSHNNYMNEPSKVHKRSSSDSQKLYDLNKWNKFIAPPDTKLNTHENTSRFRK